MSPVIDTITPTTIPTTTPSISPTLEPSVSPTIASVVKVNAEPTLLPTISLAEQSTTPVIVPTNPPLLVMLLLYNLINSQTRHRMIILRTADEKLVFT